MGSAAFRPSADGAVISPLALLHSIPSNLTECSENNYPKWPNKRRKEKEEEEELLEVVLNSEINSSAVYRQFQSSTGNVTSPIYLIHNYNKYFPLEIPRDTYYWI